MKNTIDHRIDNLNITYKGKEYIAECDAELIFTKEPAIAATYSSCGQMIDQSWSEQFNVKKINIIGDIVLWDFDNNNYDYGITSDEYDKIQRAIQEQANYDELGYFVRTEMH